MIREGGDGVGRARPAQRVGPLTRAGLGAGLPGVVARKIDKLSVAGAGSSGSARAPHFSVGLLTWAKIVWREGLEDRMDVNTTPAFSSKLVC